MNTIALSILTEINTGEDKASIAWLGPVFSIVLVIAVVFLMRSFIGMARRARNATWDEPEAKTPAQDSDSPR